MNKELQPIQDIKIAVDAVVFGYNRENLLILLVQQKFGPYKDQWVLPGGFVLNGESLNQAVNRELQEEAGIKVDYLEQLYTFGDEVGRDPRGQVISIAYLALVNPQKLYLKADTDAQDAQWFPIKNFPSLGFDHTQIIEKGLQRLKAKLQYQPIGFDLLEEEFPFSDLENLYQVILGRPLDRRNFRKKMLSFDILTETNKIRKVGSGRPAKLFRFNREKYKEKEQTGFHFEIKYA
ncbi:MAG: NUDIX domain-containing protein [Bacteroidota bacterium]